MKHATISDKMRERAAAYALGGLPPHETRAFELHLAGGCSACRAEVESFGTVTHDLALAPTPIPPRPEVRSRLLAAAREAAPTPFRFLAREEGEWAEIQPGILRRYLVAGNAGASTGYLIRMAPGARAATHQHQAVEHCYVLEGDLRIAGRHLRAGDFHLADRASVHEEPSTDGGCLLLIVESPA